MLFDSATPDPVTPKHESSQPGFEAIAASCFDAEKNGETDEQ
jgi:hypothetical protein